VNPKSTNVVTLPRPKVTIPQAASAEQPKPFRFAVTWQTLLAFPQPMEITETVAEASPTAIVVAAPPVVVMPREIPAQALQVVEPPPLPAHDEAAWEMVVPKMVRG
jgi:hypothetical protein